MEQQSNKNALWEAKESEINSLVDALGAHIDPGIKEAVIALNLLGINTIASCEGHMDEENGHGTDFPWIDVAASDEPENRFVGQEKIYEEVAEEYGVPVNDVKDSTAEEAWREALKRMPTKEKDETSEWKKWWEGNLEHWEKARVLVHEFNENRDVSEDVHIRINGDRIHNGGDLDEALTKWQTFRERVMQKKVSSEEFSEMKRRLSSRQKEMTTFASFLRKKFFNQGKMEAIGIYIPSWLYRSAKTDRIFTDELIKTISESGKYKPLPLSLPDLKISSEEEANEFCKRHNLRLILEHDSYLYSEKDYKQTAQLLAKVVPFVNNHSSHHIACDKIATAKLLRSNNIPVNDYSIATSQREFVQALKGGALYVVKPADQGAGTGVRLVKKEGTKVYAYRNRKWHVLNSSDLKIRGSEGVILSYRNRDVFAISTGLLILSALISFLQIYIGMLFAAISVYVFALNYRRSYIYTPMIIEPFFNNSNEEFTSLRCTVIGDEVVESVQRVNKRNVTSNIVSGGKATKIELSQYQKNIAIAAKNAVGADYAEVDMLVRGDDTIVGEVNIGPITIYGEYTGVPVGKILAEYLIKKADLLNLSLTN
jgi:glutathione synthase/RimK-type ligase-like ATP-grasp enzyme